MGILKHTPMSFYSAAAPLWMIRCDKMFDSVPLWVKSGGGKAQSREGKWPGLTCILKVLGNLDSLGIQTAGWNLLPQHREVIISLLSTHQKHPQFPETSKAAQWLRLHISTAGGSGSIPSWCTKIPQAVWLGSKEKRKNRLSSTSRENQTIITPALLQSWYIGMTWIPTSSYLGQDWAVATWTPTVSPF